MAVKKIVRKTRQYFDRNFWNKHVANCWIIQSSKSHAPMKVQCRSPLVRSGIVARKEIINEAEINGPRQITNLLPMV